MTNSRKVKIKIMGLFNYDKLLQVMSKYAPVTIVACDVMSSSPTYVSGYLITISGRPQNVKAIERAIKDVAEIIE